MKVIVSLSGGMDSTTVLAEAIAEGREVVAVGFTYGSKHNKYENEAARNVAAHYSIPFRLIDFSSIVTGFKSNLLLSGGDIPEGHYEQIEMSDTVVPGRNIIFSAILAGVAWSENAEEIWLGIHSGDHAIYPDCRPEFYSAMDKAIRTGTDDRVRLMAPYLDGNKTTIIKRGLELQVPYHLTRTCYKDQPIACGKCGACNERREAFMNNGVVDPIDYMYQGPLPSPPLN